MAEKYQNSLHKYWKEKIERNMFRQFDNFIVEKMLSKNKNNFRKKAKNYTEEERREAYHIFRKRTERYDFASVNTLHRWFGIDGHSIPSREDVFKMAFFLELSVDELREYLTVGLHQYDFQVNDYREVIYYYGLQNGYKYEECEKMILDFERTIAYDIEIQNDYSTQKLTKEFLVKKDLSKEEFLNWMAENAGLFKGYSNTSLECLIMYKRIILKNLKRDTKVYLEDCLEELGYNKWKNKKGKLHDGEGEAIRKYMYSHKKIPDDKRKEILNLVQCVYFEDESNVRLLSEVYASVAAAKQTYRKFDANNSLRRMTEKRLSDLLNVATQKERYIKTTKALVELEELTRDGVNECPTWIHDLIMKYDDKSDIYDAKKALEWIEYDRAEHKRRCLLVEREDILPFVLYVAEYRCFQEIEANMELYNYREAKEEFIALANQTLTSCKMQNISESWEFDSILLGCFQPDEMYSYADVMEMIQDK